MTTETQLLERITARPEVFGGKPVVRDLRIAVEHILGMLATGDSGQVILDEYPVSGTGRHSGVPRVRPPLERHQDAMNEDALVAATRHRIRVRRTRTTDRGEA